MQNVQLEKSIQLCEKLKSNIEADCIVDMNKVGGKTLREYEALRKNQLLKIKNIYKKLISLHE